MRFQTFISSKPVIQLGLLLARVLPWRVGYWVARVAAGVISSCRPEAYWIVRDNLRHILGLEVGERELHHVIRMVFLEAGRGYHDFFHIVGRPVQVASDMVRIPDFLIAGSKAAMAQGRGVLMLGLHITNFDLMILALGAHGLPMQILSLAEPHEGFQLLNRLRRRTGFEITPVTPESLRAAVRRLRGGGIVATGLDWPMPDEPERVDFLGQPSYLPLGPARLALMGEAIVYVGILHRAKPRSYVLDVEGPIELQHSANRHEDVLQGTRRLAAIVETYVRAFPQQWMMFHPFWPRHGTSVGSDRPSQSG